MDYRNNGDFDELEPRVTPKPTVLKCLTGPSVPEVSLIFAQHPVSARFPEESHQQPAKECETYASWKKDAPKITISPKTGSRRLEPVCTNFSATGDAKYIENRSVYQNRTNSNNNAATPNYRSIAVSKSSSDAVPSAQFNNKYPASQKSADQDRTYDGIKSILKNPPNDDPRNFEADSSPISRCRHRNDDNDDDRDTVRELLLLVQNQNEQIKSLQCQVERLLARHEQEVQSADNNFSKNLPRGIKISPYPADNHHLRSAIVEKKVSIGVMTSFEFSVQNNPFVTESDDGINAVLRDCGEKSSEMRSTNIHNSKTIATLENIIEDSESHPSSIWKQSDNNTKISWSDDDGEKLRGRKRNPTPLVLDKSPGLPVAAPRTFLSSSDGREKLASPSTRQQEDENTRRTRVSDSNRSDARNNHTRMSSEYSERANSRDGEISERNSASVPAENIDESNFGLRSYDVRVTDKYPPSPDPSIHVEMREYSSDDDYNDKALPPPVGWTFYKNVVGQVNRILHTIPDADDPGKDETTRTSGERKDLDRGCGEILDSVKLATLERLKMLGVSYGEYSDFNGEQAPKKVTFDSSYYPHVDYPSNMPQSTIAIAETNTSIRMKALALKYLSDEQLADLAVHSQGNSSTGKHKMLNSMHATNMSLATNNYLQRYCLVSETNNPHIDGNKGHVGSVRQKKLKHVVMTKELHAQSTTRLRSFDSTTNNGAPDNILDITTLKRQPKLL